MSKVFSFEAVPKNAKPPVKDLFHILTLTSFLFETSLKSSLSPTFLTY